MNFRSSSARSTPVRHALSNVVQKVEKEERRTRHIRDKEIGDKDTGDTADRRDYKSPPVEQVVFSFLLIWGGDNEWRRTSFRDGFGWG